MWGEEEEEGLTFFEPCGGCGLMSIILFPSWVFSSGWFIMYVINSFTQKQNQLSPISTTTTTTTTTMLRTRTHHVVGTAVQVFRRSQSLFFSSWKRFDLFSTKFAHSLEHASSQPCRLATHIFQFLRCQVRQRSRLHRRLVRLALVL